jgi:hypothetical protein
LQKKKGVFHHSSFLAGGATLAAGRLVVEHGILKVQIIGIFIKVGGIGMGTGFLQQKLLNKFKLVFCIF